MDFYNTIPSGPSSRPYNANPNPDSNDHDNGNDSMSPTFPSYPLMTDLAYDPNRNQAHPNNHQAPPHPYPLDSRSIEDDRTTYHDEHEQEQEQEQGSSIVEYDDTQPLVEPHQSLDSFLESFWMRQMGVVERDTPDFRTYPLPLARIKKVMKSDEEVKMISAEVPIMFSKACEVFISELTCRAWLIAEANKRRTLQKADVANAIAHSDMFDFLIDIIPRDDGSGSGTGAGSGGGATGTGTGSGDTAVDVGVGDGVDQIQGGVGGEGYVDHEQEERDEEDRVFTEFVRDDDD